MSISLTKGQRLNISEQITALRIRTSWKTMFQYDDFDIDTSAFLLQMDNLVEEESDFVFYNNPEARDCVKLLVNQSDSTKSEMIIDLTKVPENIQKIVIAMSIYETAGKTQSFGQITNLLLTANPYNPIDQVDEQVLFDFQIADGFSQETSIILCEYYRYKGSWKVNAVGSGFNTGLHGLCDLYGICVL